MMSNYKYTETIGEHTITLETDDADFMEDYIAISSEYENSGAECVVNVNVTPIS